MADLTCDKPDCAKRQPGPESCVHAEVCKLRGEQNPDLAVAYAALAVDYDAAALWCAEWLLDAATGWNEEGA